MNRCRNKLRILPVILLGAAFLFTLALSAAEPDTMPKDRGYLGVSIARIPVSEKKELGISHGVKVTDVQEKSAAEKAGLRKDDVILYFNGKKIITAEDLTDAVRETAPETKVDVKILRDGARKTVPVTVGKFDLNVYFFGGEGDNLAFGIYGSKAYLGVNLHEMDKDLAAYFKTTPGNGVLVLSVEEESAADEAGIRSGDVLMQVAGEDIRDADQVRTILDEFEKGDEITVSVLRSGVRKDFTVELNGSPFGRSKFLENFIKVEDGKNHIQWLDVDENKKIEILKKDGDNAGAVWKSGGKDKGRILFEHDSSGVKSLRAGSAWAVMNRGYI